MKAAVIVAHGGVEGIEIREVPAPENPTADLVRVRVLAAGLNRADILQRMGRYPAPPGVPPDIPGLEFAGLVDKVGPAVRLWNEGQRVFGITAGGAQAEYVTVPESTLAEIPDLLDWANAAAVPEAFITAHDALFTQANLSAGENLLVHAAGSGVGTAAIQLARAAGAVVFGTARTPDKLEKAKAFGLTESIVMTDDLQQLVRAGNEWTKGRGIDVILDLVGAGYLEANVAVLARHGRLMLLSTSSGARATLDLSTIMGRRITIKGTVLRGRSIEEKAAATRLFAEQVMPLLATGAVWPVIDRTFPLAEIRDAHNRLESNETFGKVVLMM
jgi:putative PIG3 family NAD(P)H quinone oxidoreductase